MIRVERTTDLATCLDLRKEVFIQEQGVPEDLERDALDGDAIHLLALIDGRPAGTARLVILGETAKIGRVCVRKSARGDGLGAALIRAALEEARQNPGLVRVKLGAQISACGFYEKLGFEAVGPVYVDAGIDHRDMVLTL
ncbi:MAG: GNAT family N-acetyltransferase [Marinibacterium sp.]